MPNTYTITMPTDHGDAEAIYHGIADSGVGDWTINYPWGASRFVGNAREVRAEMTRTITAVADAGAEEMGRLIRD